MYALSKLVIVLISPLGTCLLLAAIGLGFLLLHWRRTGRVLVTMGLLWLLLWSLPWPSFWLCRSLENQNPQQPAAEYPTADAIVLLGGGMQGRDLPWVHRPEASNAAADRVWFTAQLYKAGRAPWIIVSAGSSPDAGQPEAEAMAALLQDFGVPGSALLLDAQSRNTWQNALYSQQLMQAHHLKTALLVTSALHMPRALATFHKRGVDVTPAPADFDAPPYGVWPQRWLPNADALQKSSRAFTEYVGLWGYRLRGKA
ncbi:MAG TPA: YdcF family protein [Rhodanobacteraceae bacterium]|nr:YdcF family protein [Rhodanobacteraceae bacterium]